jgi:hypothetical protein
VAQYATAAELASYLQQDLDTSTAVQALTLASAEFIGASDTVFTATTTTWSTLIKYYCTRVDLPFNPVTAVSAVRLNGVALTGSTLRQNALYRISGFGSGHAFPPDLLEVDLTYGYTTVFDDVKKAVLEIAAGMYSNPTTVQSESIDDYTVRYVPGTEITPGRPWRDVAADYRGLILA